MRILGSLVEIQEKKIGSKLVMEFILSVNHIKLALGILSGETEMKTRVTTSTSSSIKTKISSKAWSKNGRI